MSTSAQPASAPVNAAIGELLTVKEVAAYCRVSQETVRRLIRSGALKAIHSLGSRPRVRTSDLVAFLAQQN